MGSWLIEETRVAQPDTVQRILDTAEWMFAREGFDQTSLRAITSKAGVNLAAVNYHFGSKEALIQAVFDRFLKPFTEQLEASLHQMACENPQPSLEQLLALISRAAYLSQKGDTRRVELFFRLSGLAYTQTLGHLRRHIQSQHGELFRRCVLILMHALPDVPPGEVFWRVHFALGATIFTLSSMEPLRAIYRNDFSSEISYQDVEEKLLNFLARGIQADLPE